GGSVQFSASLIGLSGGVDWSASAGTITASGLFIAPVSMSAGTTVTITAVSQADRSQSGSTQLSVSGEAPSSAPNLVNAYVYPNPAVAGQTPVVRAFLGLVDSVEITVFDVSGRQ